MGAGRVVLVLALVAALHAAAAPLAAPADPLASAAGTDPAGLEEVDLDVEPVNGEHISALATNFASDGHAAVRAGRIRDAKKFFARAAAADPHEASYRVFLGNMQQRLGEHAAALRTFQSALALAGSLDVHVSLMVPLEAHPDAAAARQKRFEDIFRHHVWAFGNGDFHEIPVSGTRATLAATARLRAWLPHFLAERGIAHLLDAGCGDLHWLHSLTLPSLQRYVGVDIVPSLVRQLPALVGPQHIGVANVSFVHADVTSQDVVRREGPFDLVLARELIPHLRMDEILAFIGRVSTSGARFLLADTWPRVTRNTEQSDDHFQLPGGRRRVNLELPPYSLGKPEEVFDVEEIGSGKVLGLWRLPLRLSPTNSARYYDKTEL